LRIVSTRAHQQSAFS